MKNTEDERTNENNQEEQVQRNSQVNKNEELTVVKQSTHESQEMT